MDFNKFVNIVYQQRIEFEQAIQRTAKALTLQDVIKEIRFNPFDFARYDNKFTRGHSLKFLIAQGHLHVVVLPESLSLVGPYDVQVAWWKGKEAKEYYDSLVAQIERAQEELNENIPF